MASEMVERVARAIRKQVEGRDTDRPIIGDGEHGVGLYTDVARAAIAAMRGPTKSMLAAGDGKVNDAYFGDTLVCAETVWDEMIDASLKVKE